MNGEEEVSSVLGKNFPGICPKTLNLHIQIILSDKVRTSKFEKLEKFSTKLREIEVILNKFEKTLGAKFN